MPQSLANEKELSRMIYREPQPISVGEAERILASNDSNAIASTLVDIAYHERDWAQNKCLAFARYPEPNVRQVAVNCLGDIARIHRTLDLARVLPVLDDLSGDTEVTTEDALDDIRMFIPNVAL
jgi:hypothetical protein